MSTSFLFNTKPLFFNLLEMAHVEGLLSYIFKSRKITQFNLNLVYKTHSNTISKAQTTSGLNQFMHNIQCT